MRSFFLAFFVLMLVLRGWVGDAMAVEMAMRVAMPQVQTAAQSKSQSHCEQMAMHKQGKTDNKVQDGVVCSACSVCHAAAFPGLSATQSLVAATFAVPLFLPEASTSADLAPLQKTPIS